MNLPKSNASRVTKKLQILGQKYERYHTMSGGRDNLANCFFYFNKPIRRKLTYKYAKINNTRKERIFQNEGNTTKIHEINRIESD